MTVEPGALRAIADELEAAQLAAETEAIERLTELVNGSLPVEQAAEAADREAAVDLFPPDDPQREAQIRANVARAMSPSTSASADPTPGVLTCRKCGRAFPLGKGIRTHERWCKGTRASAQDRSQTKSTKTRVPEPLRAHSYLCRFCSASFKDKLDLEVHEASHPPAATPKFVGAPKVGGLEAVE